MTEASSLRRDRYLVTDPMGQMTFDISFPLENEDYLRVYIDGEEITEFQVDLEALTIELDDPAAQGAIVTIEGLRVLERSNDFARRGSIASGKLNAEFDAIMQTLQELRRDVDRTLQLNKAEDIGISAVLPLKSVGKALKWSAAGLVNSEVDIDDLDAAISDAQQFAAQAAASKDAAALSETAAQTAESNAEIWASVSQLAAAGISWGKVRAASTANVNIASAPSSIDGIALDTTDRILLKDQTDQKQNGVYVFNGTGNALTRSTDADNWLELVSKVVVTEQGTALGNEIPYICTVNKGGTLGVTNITWAIFTVPLLDASVTTAKIADGNVTYQKVAAAAIAGLGDWAAGTANKILNAANFLPAMLSALGYNKIFTSAAQTITLSGSLTIPHGLGVEPIHFKGFLVCQTTEFGWAVGEKPITSLCADFSTATSGMSVWADATNIYVKFGSANVATVINRTTSASAAITPANWKLLIRAWG